MLGLSFSTAFILFCICMGFSEKKIFKKISTHILTVLTTSVIVHIERREKEKEILPELEKADKI